ncbi:glycosyltransferase [Mesorhizobium sp. M0293]|uniref:glycosyltransferase n=1 Tax=unclassified Mesorhizobium TaxID=325217 RepID=UPI00333DCBD3
MIANDHAFVNGGQAKIALESALNLKRQGLDVSFVAGQGPADPRLDEAGIECTITGSHDILSDPDRLHAATCGLWNPAAARALARAIDARDPVTTIVHVHGWSKALSPSIGPVVVKAKTPHVFTLHEYFLACPNGGFYNYQTGTICQKRALGAKCLTTQCDPRHAGHKAWRVARQVVVQTLGLMPRGLRDVIYLTARQLSLMRPYFPADARWHYLPNPVEIRSDERVTAEDNETFLFIGRLSPEKGADIAAAAARIAGVKIAFAGDGEARDAVTRANPDAVMLGWLNSDQLVSWMRKARCVVFPSRWYETYGLVVAEALRLGLPVLVSRSSVAAELVRHGESGFHVEAGNVEQWAAFMGQLRHDATARMLSHVAYAAGAKIPGYNDYTDELLAIYDRISADRKSFR